MDWDLTMNLYLSTAMAMLVREDMYTVTHGKVFTNLGSSGLVVCGGSCCVLIMKMDNFEFIYFIKK